MLLLNDLQDLYSALLSEETKHFFKVGISFQQEYQMEVEKYYQKYIKRRVRVAIIFVYYLHR